jgi:hypothetical protein
MKTTNPFPSVLVSIPEDAIQDFDDQVVSYWKDGDTSLLQMSAFVRQSGEQVSAQERLAARMEGNQKWALFNVSRSPKGCEVAAAVMVDTDGVSWIHVYLVWPWLAVHVSISRGGSVDECDWAWDSVASIRPAVM